MKIQILSREKIKLLSAKGFKPNTAVISITDAGLDFAELKNAPEYLLQVAFNDIDNDVFMDELGRQPTDAERKRIEEKYKMLTDEQAQQIADFYNQVKKQADVFICQCEHGQSRSAAVAAAFLEKSSKRGIDVFVDDKYYPNKTVFKKVFNALKFN